MVIDPAFWRGKRVFLTGHTGFKGAWMALILHRLGAEVHGFALEPESPHGVFEAADVRTTLRGHHIGDIRDRDAVAIQLRKAAPEIVLHMAAQALVRRSYSDPVATYATNVMGTVHVLEAVRLVPAVRAVVVVTSDKCYENVGQAAGYREGDRLGGRDPYSNSKACAELVVAAYRQSFFAANGATNIATARAGNVIGGGDWAEDRLVPDAIRAFAAGKPLRVRNPDAVRPWQHVLDPLSGYLALAERLATDGERYAEAWNFGPRQASEVPVRTIIDRLAGLWGAGASWERDQSSHHHEAAYLALDSTRAEQRLGWRPSLDLDEALRLTVDWYRDQTASAHMRARTDRQIEAALNSERVT